MPPRRQDVGRSPSSFIACLEGCVKMLNYFVALMGLSMIGVAVYFMLQLTGAMRAEAFLSQHLTGSTGKVVTASWFIIGFGCAGFYVFLTALTALCGASARSAACLNVNVTLMLFGLAGQFLLALVFFLDESWEKRLPPDPAYDQVKAFIKKQIVVCKWFAIGALAVQLLSLLLTLVLQSAYVHQDELLDDEEADWRRRPLLPDRDHRSAPPIIPQGGAPRSDAWSARMREQYGLDTSRYSYNPSPLRGPAPGMPVAPATTSRPPASGSGCVVM